MAWFNVSRGSFSSRLVDYVWYRTIWEWWGIQYWG